MIGRGAMIVAALALAGGCSSEAESFSLRLTWSQPGEALACPTGGGVVASCATIPMSCDARVLVSIVPRAGGVAYHSHCYRLTGATDACALADLAIVPSSPIPNQMVKLQVAVWSEEQLAGLGLDPDACPEAPQFDDYGRPLVLAAPALVPALGGQILFPVGDRHVAEVELGCPRHDLLDLDSCRQGAPRIEATIRDPQSWASVPPELADLIDVRFRAPTANGKGGWDLSPGGVTPLVPSAGGELTWGGPLADEVPALGCLRVGFSEPRSTPAAICHDTAVTSGLLAVEGFVVRKALVDKLLAALGVADFPDAGLVLGIVVDDRNNRVAGAKVTVNDGTVEYPTVDFQHVGLDATSASGLFLSRDAPFDAVWQGTSASGVGDDHAARGGLIVGHISVVVVRLTPPIGGKQTR